MRKKGYKQMQRRLLRETALRMYEHGKRLNAEESELRARLSEKTLRRRLRSIGTNVETVGEDVPGALKILRIEVKPEDVKAAAYIDPRFFEEESFKRDMARYIAEEIVDNDLAHITVKKADPFGGPMAEMSTAVLKVFVVPWEQMVRNVDGRLELNELMDPGRAEP